MLTFRCVGMALATRPAARFSAAAALSVMTLGLIWSAAYADGIIVGGCVGGQSGLNCVARWGDATDPYIRKVPEPADVVPVPVPEAVTLKVPVVFANPPVPLVIARVPGPLAVESPARTPANSASEAVNVPASAPVVLPVVMLKVTGTLPDSRLVRPAVMPKVPLAVSPPVKLTVPVAETVPVLMVPDPLIVMVVLIVVACAPTHSKENTVSPQRIVLNPPAAARCNCLRISSPPLPRGIMRA